LVRINRSRQTREARQNGAISDRRKLSGEMLRTMLRFAAIHMILQLARQMLRDARKRRDGFCMGWNDGF